MRISVVLCTFNGAAYLPRQLHSLTIQKRLPDELIVHDDGSTDSTHSILESFAARAPFPVRRSIQPKRLGASANFATAIAAASHEIIACCDQDDVWYPEKLQRIEAEFSAFPPADLAFCDADLVDETLRPLGRTLWESIGFTPDRQRDASGGRLWETLVRFNTVTGAGMAFLSKWRELLLPVPPGWMHDGWIGMMLSILGQCRWIPSPLWAYRRHSQQTIGPGPSRWTQLLAAARRMDALYFQHQAENFAAVIDRIGNRPIDLEIARTLRDKITHSRARAMIRSVGSPRPRLIANELLSGRYFSCSYGWASVAQDVCLS